MLRKLNEKINENLPVILAGSMTAMAVAYGVFLKASYDRTGDALASNTLAYQDHLEKMRELRAGD